LPITAPRGAALKRQSRAVFSYHAAWQAEQWMRTLCCSYL